MSFAASSFIKGLLLGIGAAAPLGPVNVQIARRTLHHGFLAGFSLGMGAVSVDVVYAILSSFSLHHFADDPRVVVPLAIAGVSLLTYLGVGSIRSAMRVPNRQLLDDSPEESGSTPELGQPLLRSYATGLLMTLLNPMTLGFWFVAVPALANELPIGSAHSRTSAATSVLPDVGRAHLPMICVGVFLATMSWVISTLR